MNYFTTASIWLVNIKLDTWMIIVLDYNPPRRETQDG